jgi:hypothetical protein
VVWFVNVVSCDLWEAIVWDVVRERVECASWRSACSSRRAVSEARRVRNSLSDLRCAVHVFIESNEVNVGFAN